MTRHWIVSDIDGTLLDPSERTPLPQGFLDEVRATHRVVLASSRTPEEIADVGEHLGWPATPCIAEDGQLVVDSEGTIALLGTALDELLARLDAHRVGARVRALSAEAPGGRRASVLIPAERAAEISSGVADVGLRVTMGGRWATITDAGWNKGRAAARLMHQLGVTSWAAIGNAANDAALLRGATQRFAIREDDGHHDPELATIPGVVLLTQFGPRGWAEMVSLLPTTPTLPPEPEGRHAPPSLDHQRPHHPGA
ncbi:MAG: HAD hydrolase family protein [Gemmatimonadales bacterium]|nr:HAD hydrolase family protein [Gemmatimonadales bacterium]